MIQIIHPHMTLTKTANHISFKIILLTTIKIRQKFSKKGKNRNLQTYINLLNIRINLHKSDRKPMNTQKNKQNIWIDPLKIDMNKDKGLAIEKTSVLATKMSKNKNSMKGNQSSNPSMTQNTIINILPSINLDKNLEINFINPLLKMRS